MKIINITKIVIALIIWIMASFVILPNVNAQIEDPAIFKRISFYTFAGGLIGVGISIAWWITDPLSPSNNINEGMLIGFGAGSIVGLGVGIYQAYRKTVPPSIEVRANNQYLDNIIEYPLSSLTNSNVVKEEGYINISLNKKHIPIVGFNFEY